MGARLVGAALNPHWSTLTDREARVLLLMAHTAHDVGTEHRARAEYWAGHDPIILSLFGDLEPGTTAWATAAKKVQRAIARLVELGAIERVEQGRRGHRARYRITLNTAQPSLLDEPDGRNAA